MLKSNFNRESNELNNVEISHVGTEKKDPNVMETALGVTMSKIHRAALMNLK